MANEKSDKALFDKKFVAAALIIGTAYAALMVWVGNFIGKEAAGVGGVALTALATGIFKQFETLRFKAVTERDAKLVPIPAPSPYVVLLLVFAFSGAQAILGLFAGIFLVAFDILPTGLAALQSLAGLMTNWRVISVLVGFTALTYLFGSFIAAKSISSLRYSTMLYAVIAALIAQVIIPMASMLMLMQDKTLLLQAFKNGALAPALFWSVYLCAALIGTWLAKPRLLQFKVEDEPISQELRLQDI
jgi:hypothetical protein